MASSSIELEAWKKMVAVPGVLVVGVEGLVVATVVVMNDPFLEAERRVAMEEVGVLVPEARTQMSARMAGTSAVVVTLVLFPAIGSVVPETLESV